MFDIGFAELIIIFILGLIVLGPHRMMITAKACGLWVRKFKSSYAQVKDEIENELSTSEIRENVKNYREEMQENLQDIKDAADIHQYNAQVNTTKVKEQVKKPTADG